MSEPSLQILVPCSLPQAVESSARRGSRWPALERLLAMATLAIRGRTLEEAAATLLGIEGPPPVAALRLDAGDGRDARDGWWLCADPVSIVLSLDNVHITGGCRDLRGDEADAILGSLNSEYAADGLSFVATTPYRWHVRSARDQSLATTALWRAIGPPLRGLMPHGDDGPRWRARLNEIQMLLHAHPVNVAREDSGQPRVGSVWWWGGGRWPRFSAPGVARVVGGPAWVAAACAANGIDFATRDAGQVLPVGDATARTLHIVDDDWEAAAEDIDGRLDAFDTTVFAPLAAALDAGRLPAVELLFGWHDATLHARCAPPPRSLRDAWRRLTKRPEAAPPPLAATLAHLSPRAQ